MNKFKNNYPADLSRFFGHGAFGYAFVHFNFSENRISPLYNISF